MHVLQRYLWRKQSKYTEAVNILQRNYNESQFYAGKAFHGNFSWNDERDAKDKKYWTYYLRDGATISMNKMARYICATVPRSLKGNFKYKFWKRLIESNIKLFLALAHKVAAEGGEKDLDMVMGLLFVEPEYIYTSHVFRIWGTWIPKNNLTENTANKREDFTGHLLWIVAVILARAVTIFLLRSA